MQPRIIKAASLNEQENDERCSVAENYSNSNLSIARATVKPGVTTVPHHLRDVDEIYLIARGKGTVKIGKLEPTKVVKGDTVFIPAGTTQQITNTGRTELVFYCICTPRFTQDCYRADD